MKSAKPPTTETASHRRSQPVRQTRTNPPRSSANLARGGAGRDSVGSGALNDPSIDIFPAITHFADAITALPKELVRHFTLLKEVDAKIFAPEEQLFRLVAAAANAPLPEPRPNNDSSSSIAPASAPMSAQNSSSGIVMNNSLQPVPATDETHNASVFDPSNLPRRHLFRQTAVKIQEMLVSLEEKNHVISTANEALQAQLTRIEDVWPHLENEFSDEAKWGSSTHWAYPENRIGKPGSHAERARREGAAAISAAAQQVAEDAAARSDARKQAVQAKKASRNQNHNNSNSNSNHSHNHTQHQDSDFDDHELRHKTEGSKKGPGSKSRKTTTAAAEANNVGLGISTSSTINNGNPPQKRRKVEKTTNGAPPVDRAMSTVFGNTAPKAKTASPRETPPAQEVPKKRKALPSGSGQSKKSKNGVTGMSPSVTSSPVLTALPDPKVPARQSPAPGPASRPASSRARGNSIQSAVVDNGKVRPSSSASNTKPNGNAPGTPDLGATANNWPRPTTQDTKPTKEPSAPAKSEATKESDQVDSASAPPPVITKKDTKTEDTERKSESVPPAQPNPTVTTKSGRASKPSTPALATFQEAARARSSRNAEGAGTNKKSQKKANSTIHALVSQIPDEDTTSSMQGDDDEEEIDADEPTYCYCNSVSYGEMVACDADGCPREWFHLACVGLKVAPNSKAKWYCEDCKERLKMSGKKSNSR
ncbi:Fc.00g017750.m01.CDS01 [Cosmosporella sp. VM-42]